ncbi:hypothetical protein [Pseudomonas sp. EYE_354]|uniref:hypothetical protein n=1 Tax=Pseudomonas sp. EYE_354 TaxID=2853449 RepID=UPI002003E247|nr:hypothetical protein [Pseudomonas sp. EYE_354]MCK6190971.1 hypothetical protein [Pseudomonas sp. EYE_354]
MNAIPNRQDLISKIEGIINDTMSRRTIAAWAFSLVDDDAIYIEDTVVLDHLILLGALDLPSTDRDYLYANDDLKEWINQLSKK